MSVQDRSRFGVGRVAEVVLATAAIAAGLAWALPAAGIGLTLGFVVLGTLLVRPPAPRAAVLVVVVACGIVAYLSATRDLGIGYRYIPAVVPFFLLSLALPSVVFGPARADAER